MKKSVKKLLLVSILLLIGLISNAKLSSAAEKEETVIATESEWHYYNQGSDQYPGDQWLTKDFDDQSWDTGVGPFGYHPKNDQVKINTTLTYGEDENNKYPVYLFRKKITITQDDLTKHNKLQLQLKADDSAVIYSNGKEIQRVRYEKEPVDFTDYSGSLSDDATAYETYSLDLSDANLTAGENEIAVAVFQQKSTSSDLTFDLGMSLGIKAEDTPKKISVTFNGDTNTQKGITWHTTNEAATDIRYLASKEKPTSLAQATYATGTSNSVDVIGGYAHKVLLTDLNADTTYWYQVGDQEKNSWSELAQLKTADQDDAVRFLFVDDSQGSSEYDYQISAKTFARGLANDPLTDFIIQGGDLVNNSDNASQWDWLFATGQTTWSNQTVASVSGNHDTAKNTFANHFNYENQASGDEEDGVYYSYDYQYAHFVMLNTNDIENNQLGAAQTSWMEQDIKDAKEKGAKWIIVMMHKGTQTVANHISDADVVGMRAQLQPIFTELGVDMVLQGHDHTYSRSQVINGLEPDTNPTTIVENGVTKTVNPKGPVYLTINASGTKFYQPQSAEIIAKYGVFPVIYTQKNQQMFANFTITEQELSFDSYLYNATGDDAIDLYDSYTIAKRATIPVESLKITNNALTTVKKGTSITLNTTISPENATDKTTQWASQKPEIATVDEVGKLTAVKAGITKITATTSNGKTSSVTVRVTP